MTWAERVQGLALEVIRNPATSHEDREAARAELVGAGRFDVSKLNDRERRALGLILAKALGQSVPSAFRGEPGPLRSIADQVAAHLDAIERLDPTGQVLALVSGRDAADRA